MFNKKNILRLSFFTSMVFILVAFPFRYKILNKVKDVLGYSRGTGICYKCSEIFQDNVKTHELAYKKDGISPKTDNASLEKLFKSNVLIKLVSNDFYTVQSLKYSKPYILKKGSDFIDQLAQRYYLKCISDSLIYTPFVISSLTRSEESVNELIKENSNAIDKSAHLKGKTFDINYLAFNDKKLQRMAFISELKQLKLEGRCFVKFEKNGCLHITVN